jgi:hypothetical protein
MCTFLRIGFDCFLKSTVYSTAFNVIEVRLVPFAFLDQLTTGSLSLD